MFLLVGISIDGKLNVTITDGLGSVGLFGTVGGDARIRVANGPAFLSSFGAVAGNLTVAFGGAQKGLSEGFCD